MRTSLHHLIILLASLGAVPALAQCPLLFDYNGVPSSNPQWYSCSGTNYTLLIATPQSIGAYSINWGDGSPVQNGATLAPPMTVPHVYASAVATYTITFTEIATGCVITGTLTMEQSTSASIQIPLGGLTQVCAPHPVDFINSSTNVSPNTVFTWNFGDGSPALTFDHTNWGQTITHTYLQGTVDCETTVSLTAENSCNTLQGGSSLATFNPIRIWDIDDASIAASATLLCWPDRTVTFANTTNRNCYQQGNIFQRYEYWNFGNYWGTGQDSVIDWNPWPPTFPRVIQYPGIGTYEVMLLDSNYCGIDTAYIQITIVPPPQVTLAVTPDTICVGETAFFDQTTVGGANYFQWDFGAGAGFQWTGAGDQAHTYNTAGTYTVSYTASIQGATAGCADTASVTVVVLPRPTADFILDNDAACDSITVAITDQSISAVQYAWDFGDGSTSNLPSPPSHFYGTVGTYTINLTVTNALGCTHSFSRTVNVYAPPTVGIQVANLCFGETAVFTPVIGTAAGNPITSWAWDFGDGNTSALQTPTHQYAAPGPYVITLGVTTPYCGNTGAQAVNVQARPNAAFAPTPVLGCSPMNVVFTNQSTGATQYLWLFGDGATANTTDAAHSYTNFGTVDTSFTITLIASSPFGCADTATASITVAPGVVAGFTHNGQPGCAPMDVGFTNTSTGAGSFLWDFGDGTTSTAVNPQHTYVNNTFVLSIHTITLTAFSPAGCQASATQQVMVYPTPDFTFVAQPDSGCSPLTVTFPSVVGAVSYNWDFGDGSTGTGPSPTHTYLNATTNDQVFGITLVGSNAFGCMDTASVSVIVFPIPSAQFSTTPLAGCHPLTAQLTNLSTGAATFQWNYGDGQVSDTTQAVHGHTWFNYPGPGAANYPITLTAITDHGCTSTATAQVQVYPQVVAGFVAPPDGCAPHSVSFINTSTGASSYQWSFGDQQGSMAVSPAHTYFNQGLADAVFAPLLIATSSFGCSDTVASVVTVHPQPIAQFIPGVLNGCQPLNVPFQDLTIGATTLLWQFGDGAVLDTVPGNQTHTYTHASATPVTFNPSLIATNAWGCTDTTVAAIEVYPAIAAAFTVTSTGCSPLAVAPVNASAGASSYLWDMGDGNVLIGASPSHTYVNTTTVDQVRVITLTATSPYGCVSVATQTVIVSPVPQAAFIATPFMQQFPNATVTLNNTSGPGNWNHAWSFGDGGASSLQQPGTHTYGTWGSFTITLVVSGTACADTATQVITITPPLPTASFLGQGEGCAPLTVSFTNTSLMAQSYQWNFGDGGTSTADNPTYIYNVPGVYSVTLTAFGIGGAVNTAVKVDSVVVRPRANAFFVLQPTNVIVPSQPVFTYNLSANADQFTWDFGDGTISNAFNPTHYYQQAGTFDVTLIANNEWNCPDTFTVVGATTAEVSGDLVFPNAFTPNSSGPTDGSYDPLSFDNDHFFPMYEGVEKYRLEIFNRWGELVFVSEDVRRGWDGWYKGVPAKQDVYVWKCQATFSDGRDAVLKGDVTLLR
ncbi:MAG: PKD domain-containing protein [Flavobacteriales bacterium]|nr:PKD domain-containing protein [Flavobacteriales bacterium]